MQRWRVGAADAARGRGLFVLRRATRTKEVAGGVGCLAGHLPVSVTHCSTSCADPPGCLEHSLSLTRFLAAPQRGQDGIEGNGGGGQGKSGARFIGGETEAELQRLVPGRVGSDCAAWALLVFRGTFPPKKSQPGSGGLDLSLQLSFPPQLSPPERAPASLALLLR